VLQPLLATLLVWDIWALVLISFLIAHKAHLLKLTVKLSPLTVFLLCQPTRATPHKLTMSIANRNQVSHYGCGCSCDREVTNDNLIAKIITQRLSFAYFHPSFPSNSMLPINNRPLASSKPHNLISSFPIYIVIDLFYLPLLITT